MASKDQKDIEWMKKLIREVQAQSPPGHPSESSTPSTKGSSRPEDARQDARALPHRLARGQKEKTKKT